jgi:hypothetical protein
MTGLPKSHTDGPEPERRGMIHFLRAALFITTGSMGGLFTLLMLAKVLSPPFDWRGFIGVASFGALSAYTTKQGLRLWEEIRQYYKF